MYFFCICHWDVCTCQYMFRSTPPDQNASTFREVETLDSCFQLHPQMFRKIEIHTHILTEGLFRKFQFFSLQFSIVCVLFTILLEDLWPNFPTKLYAASFTSESLFQQSQTINRPPPCFTVDSLLLLVCFIFVETEQIPNVPPRRFINKNCDNFQFVLFFYVVLSKVVSSSAVSNKVHVDGAINDARVYFDFVDHLKCFRWIFWAITRFICPFFLLSLFRMRQHPGRMNNPSSCFRLNFCLIKEKMKQTIIQFYSTVFWFFFLKKIHGDQSVVQKMHFLGAGNHHKMSIIHFFN